MSHFSRHNLLLEPYRIFFGSGALYAVIAMGVWATWLARPALIPSWPLSPIAMHAHVTLYGAIGFYVFGFLLTAFPRWANQPFLSRRALLALWGLMMAGQVALSASLVAESGRGVWLALAGTFEFAAYSSLLIHLLRWQGKSSAVDLQPRYVIAAIASADLGILLFYAQLAAPQYPILQTASASLGVYAYLLFLIIGITYRIVPYFAGRAVPDLAPRRGKHTLAWAAGLIAIRLIASLWIDFRIAWVADLLLAWVLAREWLGWFSRGVPRIPILFVLFIGFSWILVFLGFSALELFRSAALPFGVPYPLLRTPALHALLVGAFGTLLIAISTRVVRGHGGLPIRADGVVLVALLLMQIAALVRVFLPIAALWVPVPPSALHWAAGLWTLAFLLWAIRYLPILGRAPASAVSS